MRLTTMRVLGNWVMKVLVFDKFKNMINIKNKTPYIFLTDEIINATNAQCMQKMVLYTDGDKFYVREIKEFEIKFKESE